MPQAGLPIIISAPSGAGKTTICQKLKERLPGLNFSVSHTTRPPRPGEQEGVHYHFISRETFLAMTDKNGFLEWAKIHDNYYGTARENIETTLQKGLDLVLELDVQGVESLRALKYQGVYIFILPPSLKDLEQRLTGRGTEPAEQIRKRLEVGRQEIAKSYLYDYIVINKDVGESVDTILAIIQAEKCRTGRYQPECPEIRQLIKTESP